MSLFSENVIQKAHSLLESGAVRYAGPGSYLVYSSKKTPYVVSTDADPGTRKASTGTCSCKWANNSQPTKPPWVSTCSHVAAVLLAIRDGLIIPRASCRAEGEPYEMNGQTITPLCNRDPGHSGAHRDGISEMLWHNESEVE